jgi:ankyrin repeat protein
MIKKKYKILLAIAFTFLSLNLANQVHAELITIKVENRKSSISSLMNEKTMPIELKDVFSTMISEKTIDKLFSLYLNITIKKGVFFTAATFIIDPDLKTIKSATSKTFSYATGELVEVQITPTKQELLPRLKKAIIDDDTSNVRKILGWNVININNDCFDGGLNALALACSKGKGKVVKCLLDCKDTDPNRKCPFRDKQLTPLHFAILWGDFATVKTLVGDRRTLLNEPSTNGATPLESAICSNNTETALFLINQPGCNINYNNGNYNGANKALSLAIENGNYQVAEGLINDDRIQLSNRDGNSFEFLQALQTNNLRIVELLLNSEKVPVSNAAYDFVRSNSNQEIVALVENYLFPRYAEEESLEESEPSPESLPESEDIADDQREVQAPNEELQPVTEQPLSESEDVEYEEEEEGEEDNPEITLEKPAVPTFELPQSPPPPVPAPRRRPARSVFDTVECVVNKQLIRWQCTDRQYSQYNHRENLKFITLDMHTGGVSVEPYEYARVFVDTARQKLGEALFNGEFNLITGQGRHSRTRGVSSVKQATLGYLDELGIAYQPHPTNPGIVLIQFRDGLPS